MQSQVVVPVVFYPRSRCMETVYAIQRTCRRPSVLLIELTTGKFYMLLKTVVIIDIDHIYLVWLPCVRDACMICIIASSM